MKAFLRGQLVVLNCYIKKSEKYRIINKMFILYSLKNNKLIRKSRADRKLLKLKQKLMNLQ